jgi:very-short-patch-repair endonuclease
MQVDLVRWRALLEAQSNTVSRRQALACGWNARAIEHRLTRDWQRALPGVFVTTTGRLGWEQRSWAGLLRAGEPAALTSWSGLTRWGLAEPGPDVHVALPHARRLQEMPFLTGEGAVVLHRTTRPLEPRGALPALPVERCVVDACLHLTSLNKVRALASHVVQRGRTTPAKLLAELGAAPRRGSGLLRQALSEVDEGARSAPEAVLARALRGTPLPPYRLNARVCEDGVLLARGDLVIEELRLLVEVDGERWHATADRWRADVERHTRLVAAGWTVLRYTASRVLRDPEGVVAEIVAPARRIRATAA